MAKPSLSHKLLNLTEHLCMTSYEIIPFLRLGQQLLKHFPNPGQLSLLGINESLILGCSTILPLIWFKWRGWF